MTPVIETIRESLEQLSQVPAEIAVIKDKAELESVRIKYLGRKGLVSSLLDSIKNLSLEERPAVGREVNQWKGRIEELLKERLKSFEEIVLQAGKGIDISLPGIIPETGHLHPLTRVITEVCAIFEKMGFQIVELIGMMK